MLHTHVERQLILLSATTAARRESMRERAARLAAQVEWSVLAETLRKRRLLPVLGPRILELAAGQASEDFAEAVEQALVAGRRHGMLLQLVAERVMDALAAEGIRSTVLKGPLLGEVIYGDFGRRPSRDIDLLVTPDQLPAAVKVARRLGYGAPADHIDQTGLPLLHFALVHTRRQLPPVELHWRIHWYERNFSAERLLPPAVDRSEAWRPTLADELAALLLFYARDGFVDLRLATDLSAWWDVHGTNLPHGALGELARNYPALARVVATAVKVAENTVGLPGAQIIGEPELSLRGRVAIRLANPNPHSSRAQIYADIGLIDGLLAPPGGFGAFVRRQLLPPRQVLAQHAEHARRPRARSRTGRFAGVLARYSLTMARLARTPETLERG